MMPSPNPLLPAKLLGVVVLASLACASPTGVNREDPREVRAELNTSILSGPRLSHATRLVLSKAGVRELQKDDPAAAIAWLHATLEDPIDRSERLFALAELSFQLGDRRDEVQHYLASAVYAWLFLLPEDPALRPAEFDPRVRDAAELYNYGLARALTPPDAETADLAPRTLALPFGQLTISIDPAQLEWGGYRLTDFVLAENYTVRGLRNRYRQAGIGAPFLASFEQAGEEPPPQAHRIPKRVRVSIAAVLRLENLEPGRLGGAHTAALEVRAIDATSTIRIHDEDIPLEYEPTAALAYAMDDASAWSAYAAFLDGNTKVFPSSSDGLFLLQPHRPGRIPVVFVHGTASSPLYWAEMLNELLGDPYLRERFEPWLFMYTSGNPILLSSHKLRQALHATLPELDPDGTDPALEQLVLVGHSQGGLLVRMMVTRSEDRFWNAISKKPVESFELEPEAEELIRSAFFFEPLPFVSRAVFISTPHRGSYLATQRVAGLAARFVTLPVEIVARGVDVLADSPEANMRQRLRRIPTSIDNMQPGNPFIETLSASPIVDTVTSHSIIPVEGGAPPAEGAGDGVVKYESAHLPGAVSEVVIDYGHSVQGHPVAVAELKRILRRHLDARPQVVPGARVLVD